MGFFWELVTLIDIMLRGHWLEMRSVRQASGALDELAKLMPDTADRVKENGEIETVSVTELRTGDLVLVRPGASAPADGEVIEGTSAVNEAMITGESKASLMPNCWRIAPLVGSSTSHWPRQLSLRWSGFWRLVLMWR